MSGPTAYPVPWRTEALTTAERVEYIARARIVLYAASNPEHPERELAFENLHWASVCLEYEDLLRILGHGLPGEGPAA